MWNMLNKMFGWDYIQWENDFSYNSNSGIARVHVDGDGQPYYWKNKVNDKLVVLNSTSNVTWLTCPNDKYLKKEVDNG